jgi:hypothetical protein
MSKELKATIERTQSINELLDLALVINREGIVMPEEEFETLCAVWNRKFAALEERKAGVVVPAGHEGKRAEVFMNGYAIHQKTGGHRSETCVSSINVEIHMIAEDTHSVKHEDFLNDLRSFLQDRNWRYFNPSS